MPTRATARDALNASRAEIARRRFAIESVRAAGEEEASRTPAEAGRSEDGPAATRAEGGGERGRGGGQGRGSRGRSRRARSRRSPGGPTSPIAWDEGLPEAFRLREEAVLRADLTQLSDALKALDKQMAQKLATKKRLDMSIAFQHTLMETLKQRVATRQQAIDLKVGTKINLYDAKEELEKSQSQLASDEGQLIETDAALAAAREREGRRPYRSSSPTTRTSSPTPRARRTRRASRSPRRRRAFSARKPRSRRSTAWCSRRR